MREAGALGCFNGARDLSLFVPNGLRRTRLLHDGFAPTILPHTYPKDEISATHISAQLCESASNTTFDITAAPMDGGDGNHEKGNK